MAMDNEKNPVDQALNLGETETVSGGKGLGGPGEINMLDAVYCYGDPNGQKHSWVKISGYEGGHLQTYRCSNCGKVRIDQV